MNIQTELLENHTARLTVEIEADRLEKAKRAAARKIAKQVNIPGFRKGKAPYNVIVRNFGEATVLNDAVEDLSQDIYRESLEAQEDLQPYGPGAWEDFQLEPAPTFIYTVPLQPTVELNDYREVRLDYEEPQIEEEMVDRAMERLREQEAVVEESSEPVEFGNRVTLDIHSEFADDPPEAEAEAEADAEAETEMDADAETGTDAETGEDVEAADEPEKPVYSKGDHFIHEHDATIRLDEDEDPVLPGFADELVGANVGDELEFDLVIPADDEDYTDIAGRTIHFRVTVKKVEVMTMPELDDELAARVTENEDEPLTLEQLRARMQENLQNELQRRTKEEYAGRVLDAMVEGATIAFPDAMVEEQIDSMIEDFEQRLRQQGMDMNTYITVTGQSQEDIRAQYHDPAVSAIRRSLVLGELSQAEEITVKEAQIEKRIDDMLLQFGDQAAGLRSIFDTPQMRGNLVNELLRDNVLERIVLIGRGMEIPVEEDEDEDEAESVADVEAEAEPVVEDAEFTEVTAEDASTEEVEAEAETAETNVDVPEDAESEEDRKDS